VRRVRVRPSCRQDLQIKVRNLPSGAYSVLVDGTDQGTIGVFGGEGEIEFDTRPGPGEFLLDFDPFGEIDIVRDATGALVLSLDPACTIP
jgi:hypothetical protein